MDKEKKEGKPPLEEGKLAFRMNFSLPLSLALRFRREVPDRQRSEVVAKLIEQYLDREQLGEE